MIFSVFGISAGTAEEYLLIPYINPLYIPLIPHERWVKKADPGAG